jgi:hypothetical protein
VRRKIFPVACITQSKRRTFATAECTRGVFCIIILRSIMMSANVFSAFRLRYWRHLVPSLHIAVLPFKSQWYLYVPLTLTFRKSIFWVLYDSQSKYVVLNSVNQLSFVKETCCVFFQVRTDSSNTISYMNFGLLSNLHVSTFSSSERLTFSSNYLYQKESGHCLGTFITRKFIFSPR